MNDIIFNDSMRKQEKLLEQLITIQERAYLAIQERESEKSPKKLRPYTINVQVPTAVPVRALQVLPRNISRNDVAMVNMGPGNLLVCNTWFDPISILQQFSDPTNPDAVLPAPNQVIEIAYLVSGGNLTITGTDALWVYNTTQNAVLTMIETVFAKASATNAIMGYDGAMGQGYMVSNDVDGNPNLVKGLR